MRLFVFFWEWGMGTGGAPLLRILLPLLFVSKIMKAVSRDSYSSGCWPAPWGLRGGLEDCFQLTHNGWDTHTPLGTEACSDKTMENGQS